MKWFSSGYLLSINKTETGTRSPAGCLDNSDQIPATVTAANCWELSTSLQGREAEGRSNIANSVLELQTKVREDFTIMEKAPTSAFTFKTLC